MGPTHFPSSSGSSTPGTVLPPSQRPGPCGVLHSVPFGRGQKIHSPSGPHSGKLHTGARGVRPYELWARRNACHACTGTVRAFLLLYIAMYAAFGVASPFMPAFLVARGLPSEGLGLLLGIGIGVRMLCAPLAGRVGDATHA